MTPSKKTISRRSVDVKKQTATLKTPSRRSNPRAPAARTPATPRSRSAPKPQKAKTPATPTPRSRKGPKQGGQGAATPVRKKSRQLPLTPTKGTGEASPSKLVIETAQSEGKVVPQSQLPVQTSPGGSTATPCLVAMASPATTITLPEEGVNSSPCQA